MSADDKSSEKPIELNDVESWKIARKYSALFGSFPSSFTTTIRTLKSDQDSGGTLSSGGQFLVSRLMLGPSMRAPYYYACLTYYEDKIVDSSFLNMKDLLRLVSPIELATIVCLVYLYRKAKKISRSEELWKFSEENIHIYTDLAGFVGQAIPNIGVSSGVIQSSIGRIGLAAFMGHDQKGFKEYRRHLRSAGCPYDLQAEVRRWGCTHLQVGATLLQSIGLGVDMANSYATGLSLDKLDRAPRDREVYKYKLIEVWLDAFMSTGKAPEITHRGEFYPLEKSLNKLVQQASEVKSSGSKYAWLSKGKDDISPEKTPQLFKEALNDQESDLESEIPDELKNQLSDSELKGLSVDSDDME